MFGKDYAREIVEERKEKQAGAIRAIGALVSIAFSISWIVFVVWVVVHFARKWW